jgi:hypothetical protein
MVVGPLNNNVHVHLDPVNEYDSFFYDRWFVGKIEW